MRLRAATVLVIVAAVGAAVVVVSRVADSPGPVPAGSAKSRLVVVSQMMPSLSRPGHSVHVMLVAGSARFGQQAGVVLTDDNCQPDGVGVSRCLNTIRLASGRTITVRHPHDMMDVACLSPGEHVAVRMAAA